MTLPRYPAYRDSGVEWLGEVPAHWRAGKIIMFAKLESGHTPSRQHPEYWEDCSIPWFSLADVWQIRDGNQRYVSETKEQVSELGLANSSARLLPKGTVILSRTASVGFSAIMAIDMATTQDFANWVCSPDLLPEFLQYDLSGMKTEFDRLMMGSTHQTIYMPDIRKLAIAVPPLAEQHAIATFLDRETAKIDGLVREQERLIELLAEKRRAVVSHAVTKGLDPNAPMKDSGIDWLGEVPAHWEVIQLKRDLEFLTSGSRGWAEHYADDGALFIRIGNLTRDGIGLDLSDIQRVAVPEGAEGARTRLRTGDVLFSITAYLGSVAVVPEDLEEAYVSQHVALARLRQHRLLPSWVALVTLSYVGSTYLGTQGYGGTKIQLSLDDVANAIMTCPPLDEQRVIIAYLDRETSKLDVLKTEAERAVALLKERRAALISAAVTGKIDVRGRVEEAA